MAGYGSVALDLFDHLLNVTLFLLDTSQPRNNGSAQPSWARSSPSRSIAFLQFHSEKESELPFQVSYFPSGLCLKVCDTRPCGSLTSEGASEGQREFCGMSFLPLQISQALNCSR